MKPCPHCGAELRDNARFCTACMTPLNEKRGVPKWLFFPHRWLSVAAAVLALVCAVAVFPRTAPPMDISSYYSSISTAPPLLGNSNPTAADEIYPEDTPPHAEANGRPGNIHVYQPDADEGTTTEPYDWEVGKGTARNTDTTSRTTSKKGGATTTTTTKKVTTTTTATTTTTRPAWYDAAHTTVTEDGLPIEEIQWTYQPYSSSTNSTTPSGVPLSECVRVTGFTGTASNGIYFVPAKIDGKVVASITLFNSSDRSDATLTKATSIKRIYLPPDCTYFGGTLKNCTNLERLYITAPELAIARDSVPSIITDVYTHLWVLDYQVIFYYPYGCRCPALYSWNVFEMREAIGGDAVNEYPVRGRVLSTQNIEFLYGGSGKWDV